MNSPEHSFKLQVQELPELRRGIESSFKLLFLGIVIGSLILSASLLTAHPSEATPPTLALIGYGTAALLGLIAVVNYIRK